MLNIATDPCIPMQYHGATQEQLDALTTPGAILAGTAQDVSLRDALATAHLATLNISNPVIEASMRRWLTAVYVRVSGLHLQEEDAWRSRFADLAREGRLAPEVVDAYIERWKDRFNLYDIERPFLQDPRLATQCSSPSPPAKLSMVRPSGSNQPWFDRTPQSEPVGQVESFWWLLARRDSSPCGMANTRTVEKFDSKSTAAGTLRCVISFFPSTGSLFGDLLVGSPPPGEYPLSGEDLPPWERELHDPLAPAPLEGPVTTLTGRASHDMLCKTDTARDRTTATWITWARPVGSQATPAARQVIESYDSAIDPFSVHRFGKTTGPWRGSSNRHATREIGMFLGDQPEGKDTHRAPSWIRTLRSLDAGTVAAIGPVHCRTISPDQDKQEKDTLWAAYTTPMPVQHLLDDESLAHARRLVVWAEEVAKALSRSLNSCWSAFATDPNLSCPFAQDARNHYWDAIAPHFWDAVESGEVPDFSKDAQEVFETHVRAYNNHPQPAVSQRVIIAREKLGYVARKAPEARAS